MLTHPSESDLERFVLSPDVLGPGRKQRISTHLAVCGLCREEHRRLVEYFESLDHNLSQGPTGQDQAFAQRLMPRRRALLDRLGLVQKRSSEAVGQVSDLGEVVDTYAEVIEPYRRPLLQRVLRYVRLHPVRMVTAGTLVAALSVSLTLFVRSSKDENPSHAIVKNYVLTVYNKEGETLWLREALGFPDGGSDAKFEFEGGGRRLILVEDIDGDGSKEVLVNGVSEHAPFTPDTLYCLDKVGRLRWKAGVGRMIAYGDSTRLQFSTQIVHDVMLMRLGSAAKGHLYILATDRTFSGTKVSEMDPTDGHEIQSYFNRGRCLYAIVKDVDRDGRDEIIVGGVNDGYNRACLAVLDPTNLGGYAPVPPEMTPANVPRAREKYYLLFPMTTLGKLFSRVQYNTVAGLRDLGQNGILVTVNDLFKDVNVESNTINVLYTIDAAMRIGRLTVGDGFLKVQDYYLRAGRLKEPVLPGEYEELKNSVLYWDGEKFLTKPTINKFYSPLTTAK